MTLNVIEHLFITKNLTVFLETNSIESTYYCRWRNQPSSNHQLISSIPEEIFQLIESDRRESVSAQTVRPKQANILECLSVRSRWTQEEWWTANRIPKLRMLVGCWSGQTLQLASVAPTRVFQQHCPHPGSKMQLEMHKLHYDNVVCSCQGQEIFGIWHFCI